MSLDDIPFETGRWNFWCKYFCW